VNRDKNTWEQAKTAYAAGIGLRELARNMDIPEGTMLARANRAGWTQQIAAAKLIERPEVARDWAKPDAINAITPWQSAATTMQQRGLRHAERIAVVTEKVLPHLEAMESGDVLEGSNEIEKYDRMARRNFGLSDSTGAGGSPSIAVLKNQALVAVSQS
jgi:hypothetical protein